MAILQILHFPDPRLRKKALPVVQVDDALRKLMDDMLETMYDAPGIGLAATQVDVQKRVVVIDVSEHHDQPRYFVNPEIVACSETLERMEEGCLSVPGVNDVVERPECVTVRALDWHGKPFEERLEGLIAVCIQHEIDHLDGKLFIDHLSPLKRERIRKKAEKDLRLGRAPSAPSRRSVI
jgi:peptide deformylase